MTLNFIDLDNRNQSNQLQLNGIAQQSDFVDYIDRRMNFVESIKFEYINDISVILKSSTMIHQLCDKSRSKNSLY